MRLYQVTLADEDEQDTSNAIWVVAEDMIKAYEIVNSACSDAANIVIGSINYIASIDPETNEIDILLLQNI